jgi:hypothetical protein
VEVGVGGALGVPSRTVALKRAWKRGLKMLVVKPAVTGLRLPGLVRTRGKIVVAMVRLNSRFYRERVFVSLPTPSKGGRICNLRKVI